MCGPSGIHRQTVRQLGVRTSEHSGMFPVENEGADRLPKGQPVGSSGLTSQGCVIRVGLDFD